MFLMIALPSRWNWLLCNPLAELHWRNRAALMQQRCTVTWPEPSTDITTFSNYFWETFWRNKSPWSKTNMPSRCLSTIQRRPAPPAFFRVVFLFAFGRPPICFQYCSTISFAFAIFSSGFHVLFFSSQPSHFTSYSQPVPSELGQWFAND